MVHVYGFFMDGCYYCDKFMPTFETVMTAFKADDADIKWHKVDGLSKKGSRLMDKFNLKHMFPTIIIKLDDGTIFKFQRTSDSIEEFYTFITSHIG